MRPSGLPCRALLSRGRLQRGIAPPCHVRFSGAEYCPRWSTGCWHKELTFASLFDPYSILMCIQIYARRYRINATQRRQG